MKKIIFLLSLFVLFVASLSAPFSISADESGATAELGSAWYNQSFEDWFIKVYDDKVSSPTEIFGERYTAAQVQWILYSLVAIPMVAGSDLSKQVITCALTNSIDECADAVGKFIDSLGMTTNQSSWLAIFTTRPVSGIGYLVNTAQRLKLIPEAKAQDEGFGFKSANLSLYLWKISRNITYLLLILVIIIMSFMIMFRVKISPQTIITVQSALPKIILTLILITFSYAIAGFLIDLVYVVIGLFSALAIQSGLSTLDFSTLFNYLTYGKNAFWLLIQYWVLFLLGAMGHLFSGLVVGGIIMFIFAFLSILLLLWYSIKIIILLLKTFIIISLLIAVAPFQILAGAFIPGAGFGPWLKTMISHLLVYPVTGVFFFLAFLFLRQVYPDGAGWDNFFVFNVTSKLGAAPWDPPLTVGTGTGAFSGIRLLLLALSFSMIAMIPKTAELIQSAFQRRPFTFGTGIGEALGPLSTAGGISSDVLQAASRTPSAYKYIYDPSSGRLTKLGQALDKLRWLSMLPRK